MKLYPNSELVQIRSTDGGHTLFSYAYGRHAATFIHKKAHISVSFEATAKSKIPLQSWKIAVSRATINIHEECG